MVRFESVTKTFRDTGMTALAGISFHLPAGGMMFLKGESGSGKTTVFRILMKELEAEEGTVSVNGLDLRRIRRAEVPGYRRRIGYVFQDCRLLADRSVYDNVALTGRIAGAQERDIRYQVYAALRLVGLSSCYGRYPEELSGGQKARAGIARAIVGNPQLILADEPTGNLDPESSREIMKLLESIHKRGTSVLIATHDGQAIAGMDYPCVTLHRESFV